MSDDIINLNFIVSSNLIYKNRLESQQNLYILKILFLVDSSILNPAKYLIKQNSDQIK